MLAPPVRGDLGPPTYPHVAALRYVIEKALKAASARRMSDHPRVETDRHHFRRGRAFPIKEIESLNQKFGELRSRRDAAAHEFHVVGDKTIRDYEMRASSDQRPVRQFVVVCVRVVGEAPLLHNQTSRVHAGSVAAIPALGTFAYGAGKTCDRCGDPSSFLVTR